MTQDEIINAITTPDGRRVTLRDWACSPRWSTLTAFEFGETIEDTTVVLGYTTDGERPPNPETLTLFEYAERFGISYWDLRCHAVEFISRERRGLRHGAQWRRMYKHLWEAEK